MPALLGEVQPVAELVSGKNLQLSVRRFRFYQVIGFFFGLGGIAFIAFVFNLLLSGEGAVDLMAWPIVGGFGVVFVGLTYSSLTGIMNTLHITVEPNRLHVRQTPLPHWQRFTLYRDQVQYLRRMDVRHTSSSMRSGMGSSSYYTYRLVAVMGEELQRVILDDVRADLVSHISNRIAEHWNCPLLDGNQPGTSEVGTARSITASTIASPVRFAPGGIVVRFQDRGERIGIRWFDPQQIVILIACMAACLPLAFFWLMVLAFLRESPIIALGLIVVLVFSFLLVATAYRQIAGFVNSTWLWVDQDGLHRQHAPLPWFGNLLIARGDVQQITRKYDSLTEAFESHSTRFFSIVCRDSGGNERSVHDKLSAVEASFVAEELQRQLERARHIDRT